MEQPVNARAFSSFLRRQWVTTSCGGVENIGSMGGLAVAGNDFADKVLPHIPEGLTRQPSVVRKFDVQDCTSTTQTAKPGARPRT
jgi:hypothetical protein